MIKDVIRGITHTESINFVLEECCNCNIPFFIPAYAQKRLQNTHEKFFCPNGHSQYYGGKNEAEKLKEQIESQRIESEKQLEFMSNRMLDAINEKGKLEKQIKRIHKGTCPCCNRSFQNLRNHMKSKHPEMAGKMKFDSNNKPIL